MRYHSRLFAVVAAVVFIVLAAVTNAQTFNITEPEEFCLTIPEYLCRPSSFSILCTLLKATELDEALAEGELTVFAPTNEAFRRFGVASDQQIEFFTQGGGRNTLVDILLFHVAEGGLYAADLNCTSPLTMLNGDVSRTKCPAPNTKQQSGGSNIPGSQPTIVIDDIEVCDGGVIHAVSNVLLP